MAQKQAIKKVDSKRRKKRGSKNLLFRFCMCAFVLYMVVILVDMQVNLANRKMEAEDLAQQVKDQYSENKELKRQLTTGTDEEYIERVARDQLDYVYSDETIYQVGQH